MTLRDWDWEIFSAYLAFFRRNRPDAVLAEYGVTGTHVMEACRLARVPLIVHFHGYDASRRDILETYRAAYQTMFRQSAAVIAVSRAMRRRLIELGAPEEKVHWNIYGVDCDTFGGAKPAEAPPLFIAVGRFVEKKAPHLTLLAFERAWRRCPAARLRMIGEGPLLGACRDLAGALGLGDAVDFLGAQPHERVRDEMRRARCFVQHSVEAADGDCEGTPVAVLEAGATGLPAVSTRHAGIPDVIIEGETGLLADERDAAMMARHMLTLATQPDLAAKLGRQARNHIAREFSMSKSIGRLWSIIEPRIGRSEASSASRGGETTRGKRAASPAAH